MLWLIIGILIGACTYWLFEQNRKGKIVVYWYQWVLGLMAVISVLFTIENYIGFQKELEPGAANFMVVSLGIPTIFLIALIFLIPKIAKNKKS